jgi:membrane-bound lytic murein transglycosylase A
MCARVARALLVAAVALAPACRPSPRPAPPQVPALLEVAQHPPLLDDAGGAALASAIRASVAYYARLPAERMLAFGVDRVSAAALRDALASLARVVDRRPDAAALARELDRRFRVYRATAPGGVLYTGYFLPRLAARPEPDARFRFPVLGRPPDLVTARPAEFGAECAEGTTLVGRVDRGRLAPYPTRTEIEARGPAAAPVLAWVDDPVALFFLQIQGTGRLAFPDGDERLVGFAASNGRPYVSVGKLLVGEGQLSADEASMPGIRAWIAQHPEDRDRVLQANTRYVFFRPLAGEPLGSLGVPVTGGRSIATDPAIYPPGALAFVRVSAPAGRPDDALARVVLNQDAGAAIRGPGRVDVFFGDGAAAEARAGRLRSIGELYVLAPRAGVD